MFLFGTNPHFFHFTSVPYTEGLSFALIFAMLLALQRCVERCSVPWALATGLLAGLALLTRSQNLFLLAVAPLCLAAAAPRDRRFLALAGFAGIGSLLPLIPWALYLSTWLEPWSWLAVLGFSDLRETPELRPFVHTLPSTSFWQLVGDRLDGLRVAFDPTHKRSYGFHFGWTIWLVPLSLLTIAWSWIRRPDQGPWTRVIAGLSPPQVLAAATLLCGIGLLVPVHVFHLRYFFGWLFGHRHHLPFLFLLLPALIHLDGVRSRSVRVIGTLLLASALVTNYSRMRYDEFGERNPTGGMMAVETVFLEWLDLQEPRRIVVATKARRLSVFSSSYFHWMDCSEEFDKTLSLLRHARADYVLVYEKELSCAFVDPSRRQKELELSNRFVVGKKQLWLFRLRKDG